MLAGIAFIFINLILIIPVSAQIPIASQQSDAGDLTLQDMEDFHSNFTQGGPSSMPSLMHTELPVPSQLTTPIDADWNGKNMGAPGDLVTMNNRLNRDLIFGGLLEGSGPRINYLDIEVGKVTVIAINTADGGSAVATSNIVIQPVQTQGNYISGSAMDDLLN